MSISVEDAFAELRGALQELFLENESVDARVSRFCARFPEDKSHRWIRDLATEMLHNREPERYPLMNRWIWDAKANTGVLREIGKGGIRLRVIRWTHAFVHRCVIGRIRIYVTTCAHDYSGIEVLLPQARAVTGAYTDILAPPMTPHTPYCREAINAPSGPWARRRPKSITGSPWAAHTTRAALVAMSV